MQDEENVVVEEYQDEVVKQHPLFAVYEQFFIISESSIPDNEKLAAKEKLLSVVQENKMSSYYKYAVKELSWQEDSKLASELEESSSKELAELDSKLEELKKNNSGEVEIREAMWNRAKVLVRIGDKEKAIPYLEEVLSKSIGASQRLEVVFASLAIGFAFQDFNYLRTNIEKAKKLVEEGGDWERKNLLKVYEAMYLLIRRQFKEASSLLLDSIATFTCTELLSYEFFIFHTVLIALVCSDRNVLRDKIIRSPEVLSVINDIPHLQTLANSLYKCDYKQFFISLADITPSIRRSPYLSDHLAYFLREIRVVAFAQFLTSYKSVTLENMGAAFGVSVEFLDRELSRLIGNGRLACKIDAVSGQVQVQLGVAARGSNSTSAEEATTKQTQYAQLVKEGDALLGRIQKLAKIVNY